MEELIKKFNLPSYIKGMSFADASKKINSRFKDRTDQESISTEKELLQRLRDMQEYVKQSKEKEESTQGEELQPEQQEASEEPVEDVSEYAEGGEVEPRKKDVRKEGQVLRVNPIEELGHTKPRDIAVNTGPLKYSSSTDKEYIDARKDFSDWYSNPATKAKFVKNTGYDEGRLYDMTSKAVSARSHKADAYNQPPVGTKAIFKSKDGEGSEEIVYHGGIGSGPIQHELTHAGAMANVVGPALLRTLGSPYSQKLPSDINDPNFKSTGNKIKEYMSIPEEAYGNFHEFRVNLGLKPGQNIDKNTLRKLVKEKNLQNENFYNTFEDDKIVDAINKIASNNNSDSVRNYASYGGNIYKEGGVVDGGSDKLPAFDKDLKKYMSIENKKRKIDESNQFKKDYEPLSKKYKDQRSALNEKNVYLKQDNSDKKSRDFYKKIHEQKEWDEKKWGYAEDIATVAEIGNFIPHPVAQGVGKVGSLASASLAARKAKLEYDKGNYENVIANLGIAGVSAALGTRVPGANKVKQKNINQLEKIFSPKEFKSNIVNGIEIGREHTVVPPYVNVLSKDPLKKAKAIGNLGVVAADGLTDFQSKEKNTNQMRDTSKNKQNKFLLGGDMMAQLGQVGTNAKLATQAGTTGATTVAPSAGADGKSALSGIAGAIGGGGGGAGGYAALATTAMDLGKEAFGPTGVDTSGLQKVKKDSIAGGALTGAAQGALAGSKFGLIGTGAGAVIGGAAGYFGAKKQNKDAQIANVNNTYAKASVNDNQMKLGGDVNTLSILDLLKKKNPPKTKSTPAKKTAGYGADGKFIKPKIDTEINEATVKDLDLFSKRDRESGNLSLDKLEPIYQAELKTKADAEAKLKQEGIEKRKEAVSELPEKLRYAPSIMTALELKNLKKPDEETTPELDVRYKKNVYDEKALTNLVKEETNANRAAILSSSEGSGNAARANLLGTQLNANKAISDAYMKMSEANARENTQEQQFNLGVDQVNLQQKNLSQDIRAKNKGAYETNKSMLRAKIGEDLGSIGKEELYKRYPELMGMDYTYKGKYKKNTTT